MLPIAFLLSLSIFFQPLVTEKNDFSNREIEKNLQLADSLLEIEHFEESYKLYKKVLEDARAGEKKEFSAFALKGLGNIGYYYNELEKAEEYYRDALKIFQEIGDKRGELKIYNNLGIIAEEKSKYKEAMKHYKKALMILQTPGFDEIEDQQDRAAIGCNIGHLFEVKADLDSALHYYKASCELAKEIDFPRGEADNLHNIGNVYYRMCEYDSARAYYERSMKLFEKMDNRKGVADNLRELGAVERKRGHYAESLLLLEQALKIFREIREEGSIKGEAEILNNIALVYEEIGKFDKAIEYLRDVKELYEKKGDSLGIATAVVNLGNAYFDVSEYFSEYSDSALACYEKSIEFFRRKDRKIEVAGGLNNKGLVYQKREKYNEALSLFNEALTMYADLQDVTGQVTAYSNIGNIHMIKKNYKEAVLHFIKAVELIGKVDFPGLKAMSLASLGIAYKNGGFIEEGRDALKEAIGIVETMRGELVTQEFKSSFIEDKIRIYEELIALLLKKGLIEEAFHYVERAKSRALLDMLGGKSIALKKLPRDVKELVKKEKLFSRKIELLSDETEKMEAFVEHQRILKKLKKRYPEYLTLRVVEPIDLKAFQEMIDEETIVLEYFLCHNGVYLFAVDSKNVSGLKLRLSPRELYKDVNSLRMLLLDFGEWQPISSKLYKELIMPIEAELEGKRRVCIVPHGILHHLPFSALLSDIEKETFFVESFDLFYSPSCSILKIAHSKNSKRKKKSIVFAKSDFSDHTGWGNLPGTLTEEKLLRNKKLLPGIKTYVDNEATEDRVKETVGKYDIIHFATHGELNRAEPIFSRILLTPSEENDGNLTTGEIFGLDLSCYLVTLSACQTGELSSYVPGEEFSSGDDLVGLTRAFIFAGTPSVVASLWYVSDEATVLLMEHFYRNLKKNNKVHSICEAQRYMLKESDYTSPYFWAPFVLFGDWE